MMQAFVSFITCTPVERASPLQSFLQPVAAWNPPQYAWGPSGPGGGPVLPQYDCLQLLDEHHYCLLLLLLLLHHFCCLFAADELQPVQGSLPLLHNRWAVPPQALLVGKI